jgi:murein DD-endopeptidase MepM/ murein hydrolase activator NlpD
VPYFTYTVQAGDTVDSIAAGFGISPDYVIWNNSDITDPDSLLVGATLLIPSTDGLVYNVALGDTLTNIADTYGVDIESIVDFGPNQLATPDSVIEGEALVLPGALPPQPLQAIAEPVPAAAEDIPAENISPSSTGFIWPWTGAISQPFGPTDFESFHKGIDIDGYGYVGAPIVAAASGTVVLTAWDDYGLGYHVIIDHGNGVQTIYGHLSDIWVAQGQYVSQGDAIGALGSTGYSTGPHLHFQVDVDGAPVDPMLYLP